MVADRLSAALGLAKPRSGQIFKDYEGTEINLTSFGFLPAKTTNCWAWQKSRPGPRPSKTLPLNHRSPEYSHQHWISHGRQAAASKGLPENVGRHVKRVDAALPEKHTRQLYDRLSWKEASALAQLRTGMARLNGHLFRINVAQTD
jgi:hypothetical protein